MSLRNAKPHLEIALEEMIDQDINPLAEDYLCQVLDMVNSAIERAGQTTAPLDYAELES